MRDIFTTYFFTLLCIAFANFAVSGATLEYNQLELKDGKVLTFVSCSKVDKDTLRVILTSGKAVKITRDQLTEVEVLKRLGGKFNIAKTYKGKLNYGKAYFVKSKLPRDFDPDKFKASLTYQYDKMKLCEYNAVKAAWKRLLEDDSVDSIDQLLLPDNPIMKYYKFVPDKENIKKGEKVPLVIFLHGMTDQLWMDRWPQNLIFVQPEVQTKYPCYFIAPLVPGGKNDVWYMPGKDGYIYDNLKMVVGIVDEMIKKHPGLDEDRIYVTGLSSGGIGTWGLLAQFPGKFAGGVPIASGWDMQLKDFKNKQQTAIWAFNNPAEQNNTRFDAVKMLNRAAKLGADARYTKFQVEKYVIKSKKRKNSAKPAKVKRIKLKHAAQVWAYAEPDLIPWLFSHKLKKK